MGCQTSKSEQEGEYDKLMYLIEADNDNGLVIVLKQEVGIKNNANLVNEIRIIKRNIKFSLLGYALYKGKGKCFLSLVNVFKARVEDLFEQFDEAGLDSFETVCNSEDLQIFQLFYPKYVKLEASKLNALTPVQRACKLGNLGFIHYIINFPHGPEAYKDLNLENSEGKNAVALALEQGVYSVFKYVAEKCGKISGIDDPIGFCLEQHLKLQNKEFLECSMYIIQSLHIPVQKSHLGVPIHCLAFNSFLTKKFRETHEVNRNSTDSVSTQHSY